MKASGREESKAHARRRPIAATNWSIIIVLVLACLASCSLTPVQRTASIADPDPTTYPRTGVYFLAQEDLPSAEVLATYDVVVVDAEWQHRMPSSFFTDLRRRNPRLTLLAYVNLIDSMQKTGSSAYWSNAYSLWQFQDSTTSSFPGAWLAHTAAGQPVHEWEDRVMTNLTDQCPRVGGETFAEYAANWVVDHIWSTGLWDGIFLDVWGDRIHTADQDHWDIDGDGVDEPDSAIYGPGGPLDRGLRTAERIMRSRMPEAVLVANGDRQPSGRQLDGLVFESFADDLVDRGQTATEALESYVQASRSTQLREPSFAVTIDLRRTMRKESAGALRRGRLFLTATLMQNGWWAPMGADYGEPAYYDEMDGGGLGRGYLGRPLIENPSIDQLRVQSTRLSGSSAPDVFRRDFQNGIALVNTGTTEQQVDLDGRFRHLRGGQAPTLNDGSVVRTVTIPPSDGVILLRVS